MCDIYEILIGVDDMLLNKLDFGDGIFLNFIGELFSCLFFGMILRFVLWWIYEDDEGFGYGFCIGWESCYLFNWLKLLFNWSCIVLILEWFLEMFILFVVGIIKVLIGNGFVLFIGCIYVCWFEKM